MNHSPDRRGTAVRYRTIVADPPWDLPWNVDPSDRSLPYETMSVPEIASLPVRDLVARDGSERHLYLWTTSMHLFNAKEVLDAWGFRYSATLVWCKPHSLLGGRFPSNVEFILFGRKQQQTLQPATVVELTSRIGDVVREAGLSGRDLCAITGLSGAAKWMGRTGKCAQVPPQHHWDLLVQHIPELAVLSDEVRAANASKGVDRKPTREAYPQACSRWFTWPVQERHSQKPEAFLDMVEQVSPGPYVELFARRNRLGWDTWGNEALAHLELAS